MNRFWKTGIAALAVLLATAAALGAQKPAPPPAAALEQVRRIAIQHNGRNKPFDSFARETLDRITGSPRVGNEDPVATVLEVIARSDDWKDRPLLQVPFVPLREALGLDPKAKVVFK